VNAEDLLYAKTHEWVAVSTNDAGDKIATVGLSAFAVEALTDLVHIELPEVGKVVSREEPFGEVESVKAVSDLYAPVSGEVVEVNESLPDALEVLSDDPHGRGWVAKIKIADEADLAALMDHTAYQKQCAEEES
jgi:glycine cleavage system H protein